LVFITIKNATVVRPAAAVEAVEFVIGAALAVAVIAAS
jgi:hypothetical protein